MSSSSSSRSSSPLQRPTAKRSPSILVTDSRTNTVKGARAPFAGRNYKRQQEQSSRQNQQQSQVGSSSKSTSTVSLRKRLLSRPTRYADISVDKLLSNSSDIPSGQSRFPYSPGNSASPPYGYGSTSGGHSSPPPSIVLPKSASERSGRRGTPKFGQALPPRSSKTTQRLVLIPDEAEVPYAPQGTAAAVDIQQLQRSRAEVMPKERRAQEFSRMTAYFICEEFNLEEVSDFLKEKHEVEPRLYDEALYVPYALPLLPGSDGFRVRSNNSAKLLPNKRYMEKLINKSEQADYLYEYFSGVETPEDANNYSMDPEENDSTPFDPSEPQFFAPIDERNDDNSSGSESDESKKRSEEEQPKQSNGKRERELVSDYEFSKHHGEMYILEYGIVVFWNFSETHEKNILADLSFAYNESIPVMSNPIDEQDIETEEFHFEYDENISRPRIYNDMITLRSTDHLIKLTMSHAIAQSTKLSLFESRMINILQSISRLPKKLALTGELGLTRGQLLKKSGKLFKLRSEVNLSSSILDTPNFFWSLEPALHPLYSAVREYLEIDQRVQVINERCKVFLEFSDIVNDSINEQSTSRITWMIIIIIFLSLSVSLFEFLLEII